MVDLRQKLKSALENGLKNKDEIAVATIRLIIAALKDRDIENRTKKRRVIHLILKFSIYFKV